MKRLLITRGAPGSGKSTWIKQNNLENYTLSADTLRLMCSEPVTVIKNDVTTKVIRQDYNGFVWSTLFEILECRMKTGSFTVVDATHSKTSDFSRYIELSKQYGYEIFCVDFTNVPIEKAVVQNKMREEYKRVPTEVIKKMYSRFKNQKVPPEIVVATPDEAKKLLNYFINT